MKARYTVYGHLACNGQHLAYVTDSTPNRYGVQQRTLMDRGYTLGDAMTLASWLESRASHATADALPIRGMAP